VVLVQETAAVQLNSMLYPLWEEVLRDTNRFPILETRMYWTT
jgi:hypothetical protein